MAAEPDANLYRYVGNDPIGNTDPTGLFQAGNPVQSLYAAPSASSYSTWARTQPNWDVNVSNSLSGAQFAFSLRDYQDKLSRQAFQTAVTMELGAHRQIEDPVINITSAALGNTRVQGGLRATVGGAQLATAAAAEIPFIGPVLTGLVGYRGIENLSAGVT